MDRARERMKLKAVKLNMVPEPKTEKGYISLGMSKRISFFKLTNEREFSTNKELH